MRAMVSSPASLTPAVQLAESRSALPSGAPWRLYVRRRHGKLAAMLLAASCCAGGLAEARSQTATATQPSRDERLWQEIVALRLPLATTQPAVVAYDDITRVRRELLQRVRLYLTLYPGGPRRDEAVILELETLFELGSLADGSFKPLERQIAAYLRAPPSDAALHEAAYWQIVCEQVVSPWATSRPASGPLDADGREPLDAYRDYVRRYPASRHSPRLATRLFEDALRRRDRKEMEWLVEQMTASFPDSAATDRLAAVLRREQAVGKLFWLTFRDSDDREVDTRNFAGRPVLIVVWAGDEPAARRCVEQVERLRAENAEVVVVGVNLDASRPAMLAARGELGIDWPQFNDGRGRSNSFARQWGVRRIPTVFVLDRSGRLVGAYDGETWEQPARAALRSSD